MANGADIVETAGIVLAVLVGVIFSLRNGKSWETGISADFQAALRDMHIESYELLVDRTVRPSSNTYAEVYRILLDQDGRYFLYMLLDDTKGVIKPLTKERALIAARMSGYQAES